MEFQDVVRRRKMVRSYSTEPVDPAVVDLALHNATRAPNAGFSQGWAFLVLDTPDDVGLFWSLTADDVDHPDAWLAGMMRAPVVILPCSSKAAYLRRYAEADKGWADQDEARWPKPFWDMDTAMASLPRRPSPQGARWSPPPPGRGRPGSRRPRAPRPPSSAAVR